MIQFNIVEKQSKENIWTWYTYDNVKPYFYDYTA